MKIENAAALLGKKGGESGTGDSKRRSPEQCRKAGYWARKPLAERFWLQVDKKGESECWVFKGAKTRKGYGNMLDNSSLRTTHRISWELNRGPIPEGLHVLHHCDNPPCCNPNHLFLGTNQDNIADAVAKGRRRGPLSHQTNTCKLTAEQVKEIRDLGKTVSRAEIVRRFGITKEHVSDIRSGNCWKSV